jgi:hypothetical protein
VPQTYTWTVLQATYRSTLPGTPQIVHLTDILVNRKMAFQAALEEVLPDRYILRGSERYEESNGAYFTVFESAIKPAAIAYPTSASEVSALLKTLHPGLVTQEVSLAVKGTGHTPFAGKHSILLQWKQNYN